MKKTHFLFITALLLPLYLAVAAAPQENEDTEYVGAETCLECHDNMIKSLAKTPHFKASATIGETHVEYCEACHGPGGIHLEDPEIKGSIRNFVEMPIEETTSACLSCHRDDHFLKKIRREKHYQTGESCLSCHSVHQERPEGKLLAQRAESLCFTCHQDKAAEFNLPYHHKVQEARMTCWSCHDPHNTETSIQRLGHKKISEKCFECHPSQRGPFTYEHLASNVGTCEVCHQPHGSVNARLLRRSEQYLLCLECHSGQSPEDGLFGKKTPSFHITNVSTYQNCTICHVKIHGSYLDRYFLR